MILPSDAGRRVLAVSFLVGILHAISVSSCGLGESGSGRTGVPSENPPDVAASSRVEKRVINGVVTDGVHSVGGATVRIQGTALATTAGPDGTFALAVPDPGPHRLTAWGSGFFSGGPVTGSAGEEGIEISLERHPREDHPDYEWVSAYARRDPESGCQICHGENGYPEGNSVGPRTGLLPYDDWVLDAHASSALNPRFLSVYAGTDVAGNRSPPTRWVQTRDYGAFPLRPDPSVPYSGPGYRLDFPGTAGNCGACHTPAAAVDAPYETDPRTVEGVNAEGVTCDFCHKVWEVALGEDGLPRPNRPGVMSFELRRPPPGHQFFAGPFDDVAPGEDTFSPIQKESRFCAPCHHGVFWGVTIYGSYREWLESPYSDSVDGKSCQDCHMPPKGVTRFARLDKGGLLRDPTGIASHRMPGGADVDLLQNTVRLDVFGERRGNLLELVTTLENTGAGHHIPTDSPLRQVILTVSATDQEGDPLPLRSGPVLPGWTGDLEGAPGVFFAKILQETWTNVMPTAAYWMPTRVVEDTRLAAFQADTSRFMFSAPGPGDARIKVRVLYRRAFSDLMRQKKWDVPDILMEERIVEYR